MAIEVKIVVTLGAGVGITDAEEARAFWGVGNVLPRHLGISYLG